MHMAPSEPCALMEASQGAGSHCKHGISYQVGWNSRKHCQSWHPGRYLVKVSPGCYLNTHTHAMKASNTERLLPALSHQGPQVGGGALCVSNPFVSVSCGGRHAQMLSEYAQPFAVQRPGKELGGSPEMSRGAQSLDSQHLLCIHYRAHSVVTWAKKSDSSIYALGKSVTQACAIPIYFD